MTKLKHLTSNSFTLTQDAGTHEEEIVNLNSLQ